VWESLVVQIDRVDDADYGGVNGRVRTPNGGHRGKALGGEQHALADARIHGVERQDGITAVCPVEMKRLDDKNLAPNMRLNLLRRDDVPDHAPDEHARKCRTELVK
jgi:hypothetical protein